MLPIYEDVDVYSTICVDGIERRVKTGTEPILIGYKKQTITRMGKKVIINDEESSKALTKSK